MGATVTKPPPELTIALLVFSKDEQVQLKSTFDQICITGHKTKCSKIPKSPIQIIRSQHSEHTHGFDKRQLQAYTSTFPDHLSSRLFQYMLTALPCEHPPKLVNYHSYVTSLSHILKGTLSERATVVAALAAGGDAHQSVAITALMLTQLLEDLIDVHRKTVEHGREYSSWKFSGHGASKAALIATLLQGLPTVGTDGKQTYDISHLEKWTSQCTLLLRIIDSGFRLHFPLATVTATLSVDGTNDSCLIPKATNAPWSKFSTGLDLLSLLLITDALLPQCRTSWKLLFCDTIHGKSFEALVKHVVDSGPCVLVIRDSEGHIFGGFTGTPLTIKPQFSGDETSFLFTLYPTLRVYPVTGRNNNYLYFNRGQTTMLNGLGMGGQLSYCGLWLDADYGKGYSRAEPTCTTYGSPQLSKSPNFTFNQLEVWNVGETSNMQGRTVSKKSILDKDAGAKMLLNMVNRPQHSAGIRIPESDDDEPGASHTAK